VDALAVVAKGQRDGMLRAAPPDRRIDTLLQRHGRELAVTARGASGTAASASRRDAALSALAAMDSDRGKPSGRAGPLVAPTAQMIGG
jgi:hypothetical protein